MTRNQLAEMEQRLQDVREELERIACLLRREMYRTEGKQETPRPVPAPEECPPF